MTNGGDARTCAEGTQCNRSSSSLESIAARRDSEHTPAGVDNHGNSHLRGTSPSQGIDQQPEGLALRSFVHEGIVPPETFDPRLNIVLARFRGVRTSISSMLGALTLADTYWRRGT